MNAIQLPNKFDPYIINHMNNELRNQLDSVFQEGIIPINPLKPHIYTHPKLPGWIIKGQRNDLPFHTSPDTHIYRVRRALRLQNLIDKYHFTEVVVPKKFLYQDKGQWYVIAEKLDLDEKACITDLHLKEWIKNETLTQKDITPKQAFEMATLCFEGELEDINESNINFTKEGKIALVDTEPLNRGDKKALKHLFKFPNLKPALQFKKGIENSERLYALCSSNEARNQIRQIESQKLWELLTKIIQAAALPLIASTGALLMVQTPLFIGLASAATLVASVNGIANFSLLLFSTFTYLHYRSFLSWLR